MGNRRSFLRTRAWSKRDPDSAGNQQAKKIGTGHDECGKGEARLGVRNALPTRASNHSLFPSPHSLPQTASDNDENVKSLIFIAGIIITNGDSSSPTRTGLPISSMLLSMIAGDSLKRKFLIGYLISPFSM